MSKLRILENEILKITIADRGAEILNIYHKNMKKEVLWGGDPEYWDRRSPVLFPNVGRHQDNCYWYEGKKYNTVLHGFAKDQIFQCTKQEKNQLEYRISDTGESWKSFPFAFEFTILYTLEGNRITVEWRVKNQNDKTMYFTIGGHPGFNVPILDHTKQTDYKLLFKPKQPLKYKLVVGMSGTTDGSKTYPLKLEDFGEYQGCQITEHMFDKDALIFDDAQIDWVGIGYPDGTPYVTMDCRGFTNFGIWTAPQGPFICLEPWQGRCDDYGFQGDISEKTDVVILEERKEFQLGYSVNIYEWRESFGEEKR